MVSSGLVLLLLGQIWMMLQAGTRFYLKVRGQSEVQRDALLALRWLSKDLAEGASLSFRHYNPDNPSIDTVRNGLVFGSPKDLEGNVHYDSRGRLLWTSVTAYYIDPDTNTLFRTKKALDEHQVSAPLINDEDHGVDLLADIEDRRTIARNVIDIETVQGPRNVRVTLRCRNEELGFGLTVRTKLEMKNK
jgi:hypothetical protein